MKIEYKDLRVTKVSHGGDAYHDVSHTAWHVVAPPALDVHYIQWGTSNMSGADWCHDTGGSKFDSLARLLGHEVLVSGAPADVEAGVYEDGTVDLDELINEVIEAVEDGDVTVTSPGLTPERPYRNAHWTGDLAASGTRVYTRHYATREQAEADADRMAADGETVNLEVWDVDLADDPINQGWALYGHRAAAEEDGRAVTITPEQIADLRSRLRMARRAAHGDSNDAEIQSWQVVGEAIDDIIGAES